MHTEMHFQIRKDARVHCQICAHAFNNSERHPPSLARSAAEENVRLHLQHSVASSESAKHPFVRQCTSESSPATVGIGLRTWTRFPSRGSPSRGLEAAAAAMVCVDAENLKELEESSEKARKMIGFDADVERWAQ